jgi:hypothetical protein
VPESRGSTKYKQAIKRGRCKSVKINTKKRKRRTRRKRRRRRRRRKNTRRRARRNGARVPS